MAQLSSLLGSMLCDMIRAQHEADLYSLSLREAYGAQGEIREARVPGAQLAELELTLQYAVRKTDVPHEEAETDYPTLRRFFGDLSQQLARTALTGAVSAVSSADVENSEGLDLLLSKEQDLERGFGRFLCRKIGAELRKRTAALVEPDGRLDTELLIRSVMQVIDTHLLRNPDLEGWFGQGAEGDERRKKTRSTLAATMTVLADKRARDYNFIRRKVFSTQEIILTADELKKVPAGAIQTLRLRVSPNGFRPADALSDAVPDIEIPDRP